MATHGKIGARLEGNKTGKTRQQDRIERELKGIWWEVKNEEEKNKCFASEGRKNDGLK